MMLSVSTLYWSSIVKVKENVMNELQGWEATTGIMTCGVFNFQSRQPSMWQLNIASKDISDSDPPQNHQKHFDNTNNKKMRIFTRM